MTEHLCNLSETSLQFIEQQIRPLVSFQAANTLLHKTCGIQDFFPSKSSFKTFQSARSKDLKVENRRAFGDFQTNATLAQQIVKHLKGNPTLLLEPTCGKGIFILAALQQFPSLKTIIGIEIYPLYVWETKWQILEYFLKHPDANKPDIYLFQDSIFHFPLEDLAQANTDAQVLILGNPPWVTNAELGTLEVNNLPIKSNFKKQKGLDARTGKGNFDIAEAITLRLLQTFGKHQGHFSFLVKNTVIKNILIGQQNAPLPIGQFQQYQIDARKEFQATVKASLFCCALASQAAYTCTSFDFYTQKKVQTYGWTNEKFVNNIQTYKTVEAIDGYSPFEWRQGVKHDCAKVMELRQVEALLQNGFQETVDIEETLCYDLLKGSDLKVLETKSYHKKIIIPQQKIGEATNYIQEQYPKTFQYLNQYQSLFAQRKSSIYKGKPPFSIFGIGPYAFAPYKVAIAGLYKRTQFTLIHPKTKAVMLDDTCYFIGFQKLKDAQIAQFLLNSPEVQALLNAIIFMDAKRPITKTLLMRIDLRKVFAQIDIKEAQIAVKDISSQDWSAFGKLLD